jgi:hypothetical protein
MVCEVSLNCTGLGNRFKDNFDKAAAAIPVGPVDWGQGIWQRLFAIYTLRKEFTHVASSISRNRLLLQVTEADRAIYTLREGIVAVSALVGNSIPPWIGDNDDAGWKGRSGIQSYAHARVTRAGVSEDDPTAVRIAYVVKGKEHICEIAAPGTDYRPLLDDLVTRLQQPASAIRAYVGTQLVEERQLAARGS